MDNKIGQKVIDFFTQFKLVKDPEGGVIIGKLGSFSVKNIPTNLMRYADLVKDLGQSMVQVGTKTFKATTYQSVNSQQAATSIKVEQSVAPVTTTWVKGITPRVYHPVEEKVAEPPLAPTLSLGIEDFTKLRQAKTPEEKERAKQELGELGLGSQNAEILLNEPSLEGALEKLEQRGVNKNLLDAMKNTWLQDSLPDHFIEKEIDYIHDVPQVTVTRLSPRNPSVPPENEVSSS